MAHAQPHGNLVIRSARGSEARDLVSPSPDYVISNMRWTSLPQDEGLESARSPFAVNGSILFDTSNGGPVAFEAVLQTVFGWVQKTASRTSVLIAVGVDVRQDRIAGPGGVCGGDGRLKIAADVRERVMRRARGEREVSER